MSLKHRKRALVLQAFAYLLPLQSYASPLHAKLCRTSETCHCPALPYAGSSVDAITLDVLASRSTPLPKALQQRQTFGTDTAYSTTTTTIIV